VALGRLSRGPQRLPPDPDVADVGRLTLGNGRQPGAYLVRADETLEQAALNLYERLGDSRLSFTDCVSFAVMRGLDIPIAFAFDRHFERAGFRRLRQRDL
jgi:predicted nucleic acid-binding protein